MSELGDVRVVVICSDEPADLAQRVTVAIGEHAREDDELHVSHAVAPGQTYQGHQLMRYSAMLVMRPRRAALRSDARSEGFWETPEDDE